MKSLPEVRLPPLAVVLLLAVLMWFSARAWPGLVLAFPFRRTLAAGIAIFGAAACVLGVADFRRHGTTVHPLQPEAASSLVVSGIYRISRNPMYLGMVVFLAAWSIWLAHPVGAAGPVILAAWLHLVQIPFEEQALRERFGEHFERYARQVRRWL
jgi:protein-S-isoprenylcysteine O-methyltransferase Ste14